MFFPTWNDSFTPYTPTFIYTRIYQHIYVRIFWNIHEKSSPSVPLRIRHFSCAYLALKKNSKKKTKIYPLGHVYRSLFSLPSLSSFFFKLLALFSSLSSLLYGFLYVKSFHICIGLLPLLCAEWLVISYTLCCNYTLANEAYRNHRVHLLFFTLVDNDANRIFLRK